MGGRRIFNLCTVISGTPDIEATAGACAASLLLANAWYSVDDIPFLIPTPNTRALKLVENCLNAAVPCFSVLSQTDADEMNVWPKVAVAEITEERDDHEGPNLKC